MRPHVLTVGDVQNRGYVNEKTVKSKERDYALAAPHYYRIQISNQFPRSNLKFRLRNELATQFSNFQTVELLRLPLSIIFYDRSSGDAQVETPVPLFFK